MSWRELCRRATSGGVLALLAALTLVASDASAQKPGGTPNAVQGFSQNRNLPVKIESDTLEVRDKNGLATFLGNVHLTQGDTTLQCKILIVYYEKNNPKQPGMKTAVATAPGAPPTQQQIRRLEAKGGVIVTQKDQVASGDNGIFDMKSYTVTLIGNVVITQGQNVLRGQKLVVDLRTGDSRVESDKTGKTRVQGLFLPGTTNPGQQPNPAPAPKPGAPKAVPPGPLTQQQPNGPLKLQ